MSTSQGPNDSYESKVILMKAYSMLVAILNEISSNLSIIYHNIIKWACLNAAVILPASIYKGWGAFFKCFGTVAAIR